MLEIVSNLAKQVKIIIQIEDDGYVDMKYFEENNKSVTEVLIIDRIRNCSMLIQLLNLFKNIKTLKLLKTSKFDEEISQKIKLPRLQSIEIDDI